MADSLPDSPIPTGVPVDFNWTIWGPLGAGCAALTVAVARLFAALAKSWADRLVESHSNTTMVLTGLNNNTTALAALTVSNAQLVKQLEDVQDELAALKGLVLEIRK